MIPFKSYFINYIIIFQYKIYEKVKKFQLANATTEKSPSLINSTFRDLLAGWFTMSCTYAFIKLAYTPVHFLLYQLHQMTRLTALLCFLIFFSLFPSLKLSYIHHGCFVVVSSMVVLEVEKNCELIIHIYRLKKSMILEGMTEKR